MSSKDQNQKLTLHSSVEEVNGIGQKTAALLKEKGIETTGDLLSYYPMDYDYFSDPVKVNVLVPGKIQAVCLSIIANGSTVRAGNYKITTFHAQDETGRLRLTYFNMPYLTKTIKAGSIHLFRGTVKKYKNGSLVMEQAAVYTPSSYQSIENTLQPKYHLTKGLTNSRIIKMIKNTLKACVFPEDYLSSEDKEEMDLMDEKEATQKIHFPSTKEELIRARKRKVFDEFFAFLFAVRKEKQQENALKNERPMVPVAETGRLIEQLPYRLTSSQEKAWKDIEEDLSSTHVMNRMLQGDVGSGKTILAFLALLMTAANGRQGVLMAPTEVLAKQHMNDLEDLIKTYALPISPVLLTGEVTGKARKEVYEKMKSGSCNVIIGTHALFQEGVQYSDVGLVITDEQHRFGVRQREALSQKGEQVPILVMSATPIPRTLSLILYGDLSVSRLTELPKGRLPIKNLAVPSTERGRLYRFILKEIEKGHQAYVICPEVEEGEVSGLMNVKEYTQNLRKSLPSYVHIESLNGKMKPSEKNRIMSAFVQHDIDLLVSTTVIEVGINVPNATCMLIENAERFGLSQLHQLRGRIGRGEWQSYCMFVYSSELNEKPKRLAILEQTNDGFQIAEEDLKLRGSGDLFGVRQSGEFGFRLADIYQDSDLLSLASDYVNRQLDQHNPEGNDNEFYSWIPQIDYRSI